MHAQLVHSGSRAGLRGRSKKMGSAWRGTPSWNGSRRRMRPVSCAEPQPMTVTVIGRNRSQNTGRYVVTLSAPISRAEVLVHKRAHQWRITSHHLVGNRTRWFFFVLATLPCALSLFASAAADVHFSLDDQSVLPGTPTGITITAINRGDAPLHLPDALWLIATNRAGQTFLGSSLLQVGSLRV